jgi:hypothetical protein
MGGPPRPVGLEIAEHGFDRLFERQEPLGSRRPHDEIVDLIVVVADDVADTDDLAPGPTRATPRW